jgi:hypothetical protein
MSITISAIEGTLITAAAIIPIILLLGSVEKLLTLMEEYRNRKRMRRQMHLIREQLSDNFRHAA